MAEAGVEHSADSSEKTAIDQQRAALLRAFGPVSTAAELAEVDNAWTSLPAAVRADIWADILAKVREASGAEAD